MRLDEPKPEECSCCGWKTRHLRQTDAYARTRGAGPFTPDEDKDWAWLCAVCRNTFAGNTYLYPDNYPAEARLIMPMIAWGINLLTADDAVRRRVLEVE
jgi:hypothetical protein